MKTRANKKKLALNKISIARLDRDIINQAKGGDVVKPTQYPPCPSIVILFVNFCL